MKRFAPRAIESLKLFMNHPQNNLSYFHVISATNYEPLDFRVSYPQIEIKHKLFEIFYFNRKSTRMTKFNSFSKLIIFCRHLLDVDSMSRSYSSK